MKTGSLTRQGIQPKGNSTDLGLDSIPPYQVALITPFCVENHAQI